MNQDLNIEQMEALLKKPTRLSRKQILEGTVQDRTPQYISSNNPQYDEKLMKAHYLLATVYGKEGNTEQAHSHLRAAGHEFSNMCIVRTKQPEYITKDFDSQALKQRNSDIEKELDHFRGKLLKIADKIGYDATHLLFAQTSAEPKSNLVELIL